MTCVKLRAVAWSEIIIDTFISLTNEFGVATLVLLAVIALATSLIHGATGVAGGFLLSAAIAPLIGIKPIVPVVSVALLISHSSRALLNLRDFHRDAYLSIALPALPCIVAGALLYGMLPPVAIAVLLGSVIFASVPMRRWARSRQIKAGRPTLHAAGAVYGGLAGTSVGPGMLLIPFMLGYGLSKEAFVATLAAIALTTNITRVGVFGSTDLLTSHYLLLGVLVGLMTIPGNWAGRSLLRSMSNDRHALLVDGLTVLGAANFFWLAWRS